MMFFGNITAADRVTFEGATVANIAPVQDKKSKEITHFRLSVENPETGIDLRKFRVEEVPHLFDTGRLIVEKGYNSLARQQDRALYGGANLSTATKKQRDQVDLKVQCARLMERYQRMGMKLTRESVDSFRPRMTEDYELYQAKKSYGTDRVNSAQSFKRLPTADTLLRYYRIYRKADGDPNAFFTPRIDGIEPGVQESADFSNVMQRLGAYASSMKPAKGKIIRDMIKDLERVNEDRKSHHIAVPFRIYSQRTYERWIDRYLDPFEVHMQRHGLAAAQKEFGTVEEGVKATVPGEEVQADAWQFHLVTLDVTRERYNQMSEEERKSVKKVRRWATVMIDVATRCILGFSISSAPNEKASLEALRMCYMDKTYLFRGIGINEATYNYCCPIQTMSNDNGSEFARNPFGGAMFAQAVRTLGASLRNTVAGVSKLRGHIERFFWTCDLKWARYLPGYTANNPQSRNDRKPGDEACITDDELHALFLAFISEYHNTPHRGLNWRTPAAIWDELVQHDQYDVSQRPSPAQLRDACGFYTEVTIGERGIQFAGVSYASEFTRDQRKLPLAERITQPGGRIEIKVDPFDLGAISVVGQGGLISVGAVDTMMYGKTLRQWQLEKLMRKQKTKAENLAREGARDEAAALWEGLVKSISRAADIGMDGYTQAEIERAKREMDYGKGQHERPYIGRDEYDDPVHSGFTTGGAEFVEDEEGREDFNNPAPTGMDRFRSAARNRKSKKRGSNK